MTGWGNRFRSGLGGDRPRTLPPRGLAEM